MRAARKTEKTGLSISPKEGKRRSINTKDGLQHDSEFDFSYISDSKRARDEHNSIFLNLHDFLKYLYRLLVNISADRLIPLDMNTVYTSAFSSVGNNKPITSEMLIRQNSLNFFLCYKEHNEEFLSDNVEEEKDFRQMMDEIIKKLTYESKQNEYSLYENFFLDYPGELSVIQQSILLIFDF